MEPIIGISSYFVDAFEFDKNRIRGKVDQNMMMSTMDYSESIARAGGLPVLIAPINSDDYLENIINRIDGLLLSGGGDVNPRHYKEAYKDGLGKLEPLRDEVELKLISFAMKKNIPILGICRGFQLLNVYNGGTLIQDIKKYYKTELEHVGLNGYKDSIVHKVMIDASCDLYNCFESDYVEVNSLHHQILGRMGVDLVPCGESEDGVVEAFYHRKRPHVFAVQWHPEMMTEKYQEQRNIFNMFIEYATRGETCLSVSQETC